MLLRRGLRPARGGCHRMLQKCDKLLQKKEFLPATGWWIMRSGMQGLEFCKKSAPECVGPAKVWGKSPIESSVTVSKAINMAETMRENSWLQCINLYQCLRRRAAHAGRCSKSRTYGNGSDIPSARKVTKRHTGRLQYNHECSGSLLNSTPQPRLAAPMDSPTSDSARQQLALTVTPELYAQIRRLWIQHSIAEDRRDIAGLLETLAPNCVYEVVPTGQRWEGHAGATEFYTTFLKAFPDVKFQLRDIVIGPQGVIEVADRAGTPLGVWAGQPPTGKVVKLVVIIHFPWDATAQKFAGEKVYLDQKAMFPQSEPNTK